MIRDILVIGNDQYTALIAKFVLVSTFLNHRPSESRIGREQGIAVLCIHQHTSCNRDGQLTISCQSVAHGADGHDVSGRSGRKDPAIVMWRSDGMYVQ
jgi:hypothetical protein